MFWSSPPCVLRTVIVNLRDDPTAAIRGVLWTTRGPWLVLRDAALLKTSSAATPIDGDVIVHRDRVLFLQTVTPTTAP